MTDIAHTVTTTTPFNPIMVLAGHAFRHIIRQMSATSYMARDYRGPFFSHSVTQQIPPSPTRVEAEASTIAATV